MRERLEDSPDLDDPLDPDRLSDSRLSSRYPESDPLDPLIPEFSELSGSLCDPLRDERDEPDELDESRLFLLRSFAIHPPALPGALILPQSGAEQRLRCVQKKAKFTPCSRFRNSQTERVKCLLPHLLDSQLCFLGTIVIPPFASTMTCFIWSILSIP